VKITKLLAGSWTKAVGIAFVSLTCLAVIFTIADSGALFYLYSFDHDPKNWTNLNVFYSRPKHITDDQKASKPVHLASLLVRGNNGKLAYASRYELGLGDIKPSALDDCLLAAEDKRFYRHTGLDYFGIAKAIFDHFVNGNRTRGASTISHQLMGEVILADRSREGLSSYLRKIGEIILANAAERHFSKDDLLLAYVNNVPVGHIDGRALIGLSAASDVLFGKRETMKLTLSEACSLAGMLNRPNGYIKEAEKSDYRGIIKKRNIVLDNLRRAKPDRYSDKTIERAKKEDVRSFKNRKLAASEPRQFISYAYQQLPRTKPGLRVYLTMDADLQRLAETSVNEELGRFDRGPYGFYNWLSYSRALKEGHNVTEEETKLQAALVALDPRTGKILALVGGRNPISEFNRVTQAKRAPGSVIKPFVYLYGINSGFLNSQPFRADTVIDPAKYAVAQRYTTGGAASATLQLARSDNAATVAIAQEFGISRVRDFIARVTDANPVASELLAIGAGKGLELTPLQLAAAYTIFPNNGVKVTPKPIWAVHAGKNKLELPQPNPVQVVNGGAAVTVVEMLQSVIGDGPDGQHGTARMARKLSGLESTIANAGKTGTGDSDLWFVGFTPRLVVVVWVGFDNNFPPFEASKGFTGSGLPLQIWAGFMRDVKKYRLDLLKGSFEIPSGVREVMIDPERSCIAEIGVKEYFLANRLPPVCEYFLSATVGR